VGREREIATFKEMLAAVAAGSGGIVLVSGDPGIGKTRLLAELSAMCGPGWRVFLGHAYDSEGTPAYLPFREALQRYIRDVPIDQLLRQIPEDSGELPLLFPEIRRRLPGQRTTSTPDPQSARYQLFEAIAAFLSAIAQDESHGLILLLEDLHWADDSSLLLLEHLARMLAAAPVLIVATYRDSESDLAGRLSRTIEQIDRHRSAQRLRLGRLTRDEVARVLTALGRRDPPATLVDAIHSRTDGNPFFVHEVFKNLAEEAKLSGDATGWRAGMEHDSGEIPESVRLTIERRLSRLSQRTRSLLAIAAVVGRTLDYELLLPLAGLDEESLLTSMEEAQSLNVLETGETGRLRFSHELIRQTLLGGQALARRQGLHLRIAGEAERVYAHDLEPHLAEIALHYRLAGPRAERARAIDFATRAGDQAATVLAFEEAIRFYDFALEGLASHGPTTGEETAVAALRLKRGEALISLGQWKGARPELLSAVESLGGERQVEVLIRLGQASLLQFFDVPGARLHADRAASLARELGRQDLEAGACGVLAQATFLDGRLRSSIELYLGSYRRQHLASSLLRQSFTNFPIALYLVADFSAAASYAREAIEACWAAGDSYNLVSHLSHIGLSLAALGRYEDGLAAFAEARQVASERPIPSVRQNLARAISMSAGVHLEAFDLAGAEALAEEARDLGRSTNFPPAVTSEALDLLFIFARRHEPGRSDTILEEVEAALPGATGAHYYQWRVRLAVAQAELALARGDWRMAVRHASEGLDLNERMDRPKYEALALTARGQALVRIGQKREAINDLRRAVEVVRPVGSPAMLLRAAAALLAVEPDATLATDARQAADQILATLPLASMRRSFSDADAVRLVYRLTSGGAQAPGEQSPRRPDLLTAREVEVLRLVALAMSSKEIAGQLVLSVRTVERHIANIYLKTGTHGRVAAAAYAQSHGLIPPPV